MSHFLFYILLLIGLGYLGVVISYIYYWQKIKLIIPRSGKLPSLGIIIPFRNESENITYLIDDLKSQNYSGPHTVILVNDHSDDDSLEYLKSIDLPDNFIITSNDDNQAGKKAALQTGIELSQDDYLLFTDADTRHGPLWAATMMETSLASSKLMITGPVLGLGNDNSWVDDYYSSELAAFLVVTGGSISGNLHAMANGANMLIKRSALPKDDSFGSHYSASGDDVFLAEKLFKTNDLGFCKSEDALVWAKAPESESVLLDQKIRWASKNKFLISGGIKPAMAITALLPIAILLTPFLAMFYDTTFLWLGLFLFLLKTILDHLLINEGLTWAGQSLSWEKSIGQQVTNLTLYLRTIVALITGVRPTWKGRKL